MVGLGDRVCPTLARLKFILERGDSSTQLTKAGVFMNSRMRVLAALAVILGLGMMFSGCGSSNTVTLTFPSASQAIDNGQSITITVTVKDSKNAGVTWTISGPGTLSNQAATSVTYTAAASGTGTAMVTATSKTDPKKFAVDTVTETAPPATTTTTLPASGRQYGNYRTGCAADTAV